MLRWIFSLLEVREPVGFEWGISVPLLKELPEMVHHKTHRKFQRTPTQQVNNKRKHLINKLLWHEPKQHSQEEMSGAWQPEFSLSTNNLRSHQEIWKSPLELGSIKPLFLSRIWLDCPLVGWRLTLRWQWRETMGQTHHTLPSGSKWSVDSGWPFPGPSE